MDWQRKRSGKARLHGETLCAQGLQLCPACKEADLLASPGKQSSKVPAGSSDSYDSNTRLLSPSIDGSGSCFNSSEQVYPVKSY